MNIGEFTRLTKKSANVFDISWVRLYEQQGYIRISLAPEKYQYWAEIQEWCRLNVGEEHYDWTGNIFWFDDEKNATLFALRWR